MKTFDVYPLLPIRPVKARGSWLTDDKNEKYLDLYGGHAVISVGHSHPYYIEKIKNQLEKISFYSNSVQNPLQEELASKLGEQSGYDDYNLFLCNSGAEANENALKLASFHNGRKKIIAFERSFHGRTSLAVAATDDASIHAEVNKDHEILFLPLNGNAAVEKYLDETVSAVIIEGIQGVGGIRIPDSEFLELLSHKCRENNIVLILDEVQSGYGRSGKFFAHQHSAIKPDLVTVAKGMGNGFPVAGVLVSPSFKSKHGMLGTTFGGNHLSCAAAIAVLDIIKKENLVKEAELKGLAWMKELKQISGVKEVRGIGLMIGLEFDFPISGLRNQLISEHHILTGTASNKSVLRLLPALNIKTEEMKLFTDALNYELSSLNKPATT